MNLQGVDHVYIEDSIKSTDKSGSFSHRMSVTLDAAVPSRMKGTKVVEIAGRMITVGRGVEQGFCGILMPWNRAVVAWELVSIFLLAYTATVLPAKLAFVKADEASMWEFSDPLSPFEFAIDIFFLLDIMRNFRMAYVNDKGVLVTKPLKVARRYVKTWFALDLIASFPLEWVISGTGDDDGGAVEAYNASALDGGFAADDAASSLVLLRLAKLGKMVRLLRLVRASRLSLRNVPLGPDAKLMLQKVLNSDLLFGIGRAVLAFLLLHLVTCIEYLASGGADSDVDEDAWTQRAGVPTGEDQTGQRYLMALVHVQGQIFLVDTGLVPPVLPEEYAMMLINRMIGVVLLAGFFGSLTSKMVADQRGSDRLYKDKVSQLEQWMKTLRLPAQIKAKLRAHLEYKYPGGRSFNEHLVLEELSPPLRRELSLYQARDVLLASGVLSGGLVSGGLAGQLALSLERIIFIHNDEVISEGRSSDGMYFIVEGEVTVTQHERDAQGKLLVSRKTLGKRSDGDIFGAKAMLSHTRLAEETFTATSLKVVAFRLSCEAFFRLVVDYPELKMFVQRLVSNTGGTLDVDRRRFDAFLSHDWGSDALGRNNHTRVAELNKALKLGGLVTWFDEEQMSGDVNQQMADGIDNSRTVVVCVTRSLNIKVSGQGPRGQNDNCKMELDYALSRKGVENIVTVVMEPEMRDTSLWTSTLGGKLGGKLFIDASMSDPAGLAEAADQLRRQIHANMSEARRREAESFEKARTEYIRHRSTLGLVTQLQHRGSSMVLPNKSSRRTSSSNLPEGSNSEARSRRESPPPPKKTSKERFEGAPGPSSLSSSEDPGLAEAPGPSSSERSFSEKDVQAATKVQATYRGKSVRRWFLNVYSSNTFLGLTRPVEKSVEV
jgi:hypothetical protein